MNHSSLRIFKDISRYRFRAEWEPGSLQYFSSETGNLCIDVTSVDINMVNDNGLYDEFFQIWVAFFLIGMDHII